MISPKNHKEFFIPAYKKILHVINKARKYSVFHSDGYIEYYFEKVIEVGFKAVDSLESMAGMNLNSLYQGEYLLENPLQVKKDIILTPLSYRIVLY